MEKDEEELETSIEEESPKKETSREKYYKAKREAMETEDLGDGILEDETEKPTHTMLLDNLTKEVQLFSNDEDFITPTKKWKTVVGVLFTILLIAGAVCLVIYLKPFDKKDKKEPVSSNTPTVIKDYRYETRDDKIVFYDGEKEISSYVCVGTCSIYSLGRYQYFSKEDHIIALQDGEHLFLYDFVEDKEITDNLKRLENLYREEKTVAFIATNSSDKVGIINTKGEVIIPFEYEDFAYSFGGGDVTDYSYERNVITALKDGKWGLITLDKGKTKIDFKYDDIYFNDYDALSVKKDGLWYLLDLNGNQVFEEGYNIIIPINSYVLVAKDNVFRILNYSGEKILSKDIPTYINGFRGREVAEIPTFKMEIDGTIVNIYIMKSSTNEKDYATYKFNTVNGEVTEVIS